MSHSRRDFLKSSLGASALLSLSGGVPTLLGRSALGAPKQDLGDTVLVVIQLSGGNDGLNTVVPYDDPTYIKKRPTLRLPANEVHKIDSELGFHPRMGAFLRLFKEGHLSVVQGVGYPNSTRDHNGAIRDWNTARPGEADCPTGWVGRTVDHVSATDEAGLSGVFVGPGPRTFSVNAEKAMVPSIGSLQEWRLRTMPGPGGDEAHRRQLIEAAEAPRPDGSPLLDFVSKSSAGAYAQSRKIEAIARAEASGGASYPSFAAAAKFRTIAQLIKADVGVRIYYSEFGTGGIGGFDNHANQLGNHCAVVHQVAESIAAFVDDMERSKLLDRVLLMTVSEFGRTVTENGRRGTDHGLAAPLFLAGGRLKGGLIGAHPSLTDLEGDAQKFHTDFRRVYATVLDRWLGFDSQAVLGAKYEPVDVLDV